MFGQAHNIVTYSSKKEESVRGSLNFRVVMYLGAIAHPCISRNARGSTKSLHNSTLEVYRINVHY